MTWGDVFWRWVGKGHDRSSAAYEADKWEARQKRRAPTPTEGTADEGEA